MKPYLRVTNWNHYQHYRDRKPIWIKYYVDILYDRKLHELPIPTRLLWDQLLLLAAERGNVIPNDPELIAKLLWIPTSDVREGIAQLVKGQWISETTGTRRASKPASKVASLEKEKEYKELRGIQKPKNHTNEPVGSFCPECRSTLPRGISLDDHLRNTHGIDRAAA